MNALSFRVGGWHDVEIADEGPPPDFDNWDNELDEDTSIETTTLAETFMKESEEFIEVEVSLSDSENESDDSEEFTAVVTSTTANDGSFETTTDSSYFQKESSEQWNEYDYDEMPETSTRRRTTQTTTEPIAVAWSQCAGDSWKGASRCENGYVCHALSRWYSQVSVPPSMDMTSPSCAVHLVSTDRRLSSR